MQTRAQGGTGLSKSKPEPDFGGSTWDAEESNTGHSRGQSDNLAGLLVGSRQNSGSKQNWEQSQMSQGGGIEPSQQEIDEYQNITATEGSQILSSTSLTDGTNEDTVETIRSLTPADGNFENRINRFIMNVIIEPPSETRPGNLLNPPIVIKLENRKGQSISDEINIEDGNLWAQASVVSEDGMVALAPPQPNLISGTLVSSVRPATPGESQELGYLTFPNLAIHQPGRFRIRISLIRMPTANEPEAINLQSIVTRIIKVDTDATTPSIGTCSIHIAFKC